MPLTGPPGTGKTFVGLKVAQTILRSFYHEDNDCRGRLIDDCDCDMNDETECEHLRRIAKQTTAPILLVCYTNHALDQFMEGVLEFCDPSGEYNFLVFISNLLEQKDGYQVD